MVIFVVFIDQLIDYPINCASHSLSAHENSKNLYACVSTQSD